MPHTVVGSEQRREGALVLSRDVLELLEHSSRELSYFGHALVSARQEQGEAPLCHLL
jgi:hypothetical protein